MTANANKKDWLWHGVNKAHTIKMCWYTSRALFGATKFHLGLLFYPSKVKHNTKSDNFLKISH